MSESKIFDPKSLDDLLTKVKAATGSNMRLDAMIHAIFFPEDFEEDEAAHYASYPEVNRADLRYLLTIVFSRYTSSVDACLALVARLLPGWTIAHMSQGDNKLWTVELREGHLTSYSRVVIQPDHWHGSTLPIALLTALLSSLKAST